MKSDMLALKLLLLFFLTLFSCNPDDDISPACDDPRDLRCANFDPCLAFAEPDASFAMVDSTLAGSRSYEAKGQVADTIWAGWGLFFRANQRYNEEYEWRFGSDPQPRYGDEVYLSFPSGTRGDIPVTLITKVRNPYDCTDETSLYDTTTQILTVIESYQMAPIFGSFTGRDEGSSEQPYTIHVKFWDDIETHRLENFPNNCDDFGNKMQIRPSWRNFQISRDGPLACGRPHGTGTLSSDHRTLTIEYSVLNEAGERVSRTWVGERE